MARPNLTSRETDYINSQRKKSNIKLNFNFANVSQVLSRLYLLEDQEFQSDLPLRDIDWMDPEVHKKINQELEDSREELEEQLEEARNAMRDIPSTLDEVIN